MAPALLALYPVVFRSINSGVGVGLRTKSYYVVVFSTSSSVWVNTQWVGVGLSTKRYDVPYTSSRLYVDPQ